MIKKFLQDESGQGMVEYVLIVVLIAVAAVVVVKTFGTQIKNLFTNAHSTIATQTGVN